MKLGVNSEALRVRSPAPLPHPPYMSFTAVTISQTWGGDLQNTNAVVSELMVNHCGMFKLCVCVTSSNVLG